MENVFLCVILLSAHFLTVSTAPVVPAQNKCAEGEPKVGELQPDVNLTGLPSLSLTGNDPIRFVCDADVPRFPNTSNTSAILPPVKITIYVGVHNVAVCENSGNPVYLCDYNLSSFIPGIPRRISCTAENGNGECRFKIADVTLVPRRNTTQTNATTTASTTQSNVTTVLPPFPTTLESTTTKAPQSTVATAVPTVPITNGPPIYDDCVEAHRISCNARDGSPLNGEYKIKARNSEGGEFVRCVGPEELPGCKGYGWTNVDVIINSRTTNVTSYNAEFWTSRDLWRSMYFDANVTAVCLSSEIFGISFSIQAPNLHSLFFEKKVLDMNPQDWINATRVSVMINDFQPGCYEIGFNVGDENEIQARIGIVSKNNTGCNLTEVQGIGIGLRVAGKPEYNSTHGIIVGENLDHAYESFGIAVRSRNWID